MKTRILGRTNRRENARAFTLIELMIVVVIMGILATLAVYSVSRYIDYSKTGEAREIIGSIMAGQEAYQSEVGAYLDVTGGVGDNNFYPNDPTFNGKMGVMWGGPPDGCQNAAGVACIDSFNALGVVVNSAVLFRYASTTVAAGAAPPHGGKAPNYNPSNIVSPRPGYVVLAVSDLDASGDGVNSVFIASSMNAAIHAHNAGQ